VPTAAENLQTAYDNVARLIAEITEDPKPDYSLDGESYSWGAYLDMLTRQLETLQKQLQRASGPFEVRTRNL
jgi:hypothetical protein